MSNSLWPYSHRSYQNLLTHSLLYTTYPVSHKPTLCVSNPPLFHSTISIHITISPNLQYYPISYNTFPPILPSYYATLSPILPYCYHSYYFIYPTLPFSKPSLSTLFYITLFHIHILPFLIFCHHTLLPIHPYDFLSHPSIPILLFYSHSHSPIMLAPLSSYPSCSLILLYCRSLILPHYLFPFSPKLLSLPFSHKCPHLHLHIFPFLSSFRTTLYSFLPNCYYPNLSIFSTLQTSNTALSPILPSHSLNINKLLWHTGKYMTNNFNLKQTNT